MISSLNMKLNYRTFQENISSTTDLDTSQALSPLQPRGQNMSEGNLNKPTLSEETYCKKKGKHFKSVLCKILVLV